MLAPLVAVTGAGDLSSLDFAAESAGSIRAARMAMTAITIEFDEREAPTL